MDLATFIQVRRPQWRQLEAILQRVEGSGLRALDDEQAVEFGRLYRCAASDLNQAQTFVSGDTTVQYLNDLVARCYLVIYGKTRADLIGVLLFLVLGYPVVFRRHFRQIVLATLILTAGAVFGYLVSRHEPDARGFLLPDMNTIQPLEKDEDENSPVMSSGELAAFSSLLFTNNLKVSLIAFALGVTLGIGTVWILFYNGVGMGALMAVFVEKGALLQFATGILPHGVLEIPAVLIGGAAGLVVAQGMIRARSWPRSEEIPRAGLEGLFLVAGCVPLLIYAAVVEAGVARAPDWFLSSGLKLGVAAVGAVLFAAYVLLPGRGPRWLKGRELSPSS